MLGVERSDMGEEQGSVGEVLGNGGVGTDATHGAEADITLLLEEVHGGVELTIDEDEFGLVALRVALHVGLESRKANLIGAPAGCRHGLRQ